jgi:hypothetical protein
MICGARILDRSKPGFENNFRIEVWVKFSDDRTSVGAEIKQYLAKHFAEPIYESGECEFASRNESDRVSFKQHKSHGGKPHYNDRKKGGHYA